MRENGKQNANVTSQEKRGDGISSFLLNAISGYFADQITDAIRQTVAVSESISAQQGIILYSPTSTAAQDYRSFMREIKREELSKGGLAHGSKDTGLPAKHRSYVSEHER